MAQALVTTNLVYLRTWLDALDPCERALTAPLAAIFRDKGRPDADASLATNILTDYASDDPDLLANLLMDADPKAYVAFFPIAQRQEAKTLPLFQAEIARKLAPLVERPSPRSVLGEAGRHSHRQDRIGSGHAHRAIRLLPDNAPGRVPHDRRGSPQLGLSPHPVPSLRRGQDPPGGGGLDPRWASLANGSRSVRRRDPPDRRAEPQGGISSGRCRRIPGCEWGGGQAHLPLRRPWAQRTGPDDDARMVLASSAAELTKLQAQFKKAGLVPLTLHAWRQADDKLSYSGVWHKTATGTSDTAVFQNGLSEAQLPGVVAQQSGSLIDLDLTAAPPPPSTKERAASALQAAEAALKAKPG